MRSGWLRISPSPRTLRASACYPLTANNSAAPPHRNRPDCRQHALKPLLDPHGQGSPTSQLFQQFPLAATDGARAALDVRLGREALTPLRGDFEGRGRRASVPLRSGSAAGYAAAPYPQRRGLERGRMPNSTRIEIRQTAVYAGWFAGLRDVRARARIDVRLRRLSLGNVGDIKPLGGGIAELRIDYGPSYRIYIAQRGAALVLLLTGGDKSRQKADIARARDLAAEWDAD